MRKLTGAGALISLLLIFIPLGVMAGTGFQPRIGIVDQSTSSIVTINEQPAIAFNIASGGAAPNARAQAVAGRLMGVVQTMALPVEVKAVRYDSQSWAVTIHNASLLLVTTADAAAHHTRIETLARTWARNVHDLLAEPPIMLSAKSLVVPQGETRTVYIGGAAGSSDIGATASRPESAGLEFDSRTRLLIVHGVSPAQSVVRVYAASAPSANASLTVKVMKYAAHIDPKISLSVTGQPNARAGTVLQAIFTGLNRCIDAEPGSRIRLMAEPKLREPLRPNESKTYSVPVQVSGPFLIPVKADTQVTVTNRPVSPHAAGSLLYSNSPEQVRQSQTLYVGRLYQDIPARLDYHHQNMSGSALVFHTDVINPTADTARVQVIAGISLPGTDTIQVGRRAGAAFMKAIDANDGIILEIPPYSRAPVITQRFISGQTVSGLVQLRAIEGSGALTLKVFADQDSSLITSPMAALYTAAVGKMAFLSTVFDNGAETAESERENTPSPWIFNAPKISANYTYAVGQVWPHIRLGHSDFLRDHSGKLSLFGNYGVDYQITASLNNPTGEAKVVGIYFAPEAGMAAGVFQIDDGDVVELDPVSPPNEPLITRLTLAAGETRTVKIQTMPLNGSFYPAAIVIHAQ